MAFSLKSKLLALVSTDKTVKLWDTGLRVVLQTLEGHSDWVRAVFSLDGKLLPLQLKLALRPSANYLVLYFLSYTLT